MQVVQISKACYCLLHKELKDIVSIMKVLVIRAL